MANEQIGFSKPKARIEHTCSLCSRIIEPGETYSRHRMVGDDGPYVWKMCAHCSALMRIFGNEIVYDWGEGWGPDDVGEWEPNTPDGQRAHAHWRDRWRDPSSVLYPLPTTEAAS